MHETGWTTIASVLIAHVADVSALNNDGDADLRIAACGVVSGDATPPTRLLLANGAVVDAKDTRNQAPHG
jgi:hypothetical protein